MTIYFHKLDRLLAAWLMGFSCKSACARGFVFAYECNRGAVIMNFICQQFVRFNGIA